MAALAVLLWIKNKPEDLNQFPDGVHPEDAEDATQMTSPGAASSVYHTAISWSVGDALRSRAAMIIIIAASAFTMVFNMCIAHGVVHLKDRGIDASIAANSVGLMVLASIIGRLSCGTIGSRIEPRLIWCAGLISMALGIWMLSTASGNWQVYVYALAIGTGFGASYVSVATMIGNYFGPDSFAPIVGILTTITCIVGAISPAMAGIIYDSYGDYSLAFTLLLAVAITGAAAIPFATPPKQEMNKRASGAGVPS